MTLTLLHSIFTAGGMAVMAGTGLFEVKRIAPWHSLQLASVYVGVRPTRAPIMRTRAR